MRTMLTWTMATLVLAWMVGGCTGGETTVTEPTEDAVKTPPPPGNTDTLLLAQSYFLSEKDEKTGKTKPVPGPAKLTMIRGTGEQWESEVLEDKESNVFHKAIVADLDGNGPALVTIGANGARLKIWRKAEGAWTATTLWAPTFGGKQERLRDMEVGDVTGDGKDDIVIVSHDQGVVAVAQLPEGATEWTITEVDRTKERIFVHEVEIGDVDGDGKNEFFATPSAPNVLDGTPQPGAIVGYRWAGDKAERFEVASFMGAHVKEILVADIEGTGKADLYAAIEPERVKTDVGIAAEDPLVIRRYRFDGDKIEETDIATFREEQCRFLTYGDLTGDGKLELVASTMTTGVWMLRQSDDGWMTELVAKDSPTAEFEHAANILDLDHDGKLELVVVSDNMADPQGKGGKVRRYRWNGSGFDEEIVADVPADHLTFNVTAGKL